VSRTCKNLSCVNHEHLHWGIPLHEIVSNSTK
jgi:hypothetical protein